MEPFDIDLSVNQAKKVKKGYPVQLSKQSAKGGSLTVYLKPRNSKKLKKARRLSKGVRLTLSPEELTASGEGLADWIKKGVRGVKKGLKLAKKTLGKKKTRELITQGLQKVATFAPGPVKALADEYADELVDFLGDKTGAFGMGGAVQLGGYGLQSNYSPMLGVQHPAMHPIYPNLQNPGDYIMIPVQRRYLGKMKRDDSGNGFRPA